MVGAVIVHQGRIIGEGFTSPFGGAHAEVNAIASVGDKKQLREATLYVSLEPCSHFGKTPPCTDLILKHRIPNVVIGIKDPHEKVAGQGIARLKEGGCNVLSGILEEACREHHRRFLTFCEKQRPFIVLKWAESPDGFIAPAPDKRSKSKQPFWISSVHSRQLTHKWRTEEQAILVGTRTALEDNPRLSARSWSGPNPLRVVIDRGLVLPETLMLFDDSAPTLVFHEQAVPPKSRSQTQFCSIDFGEDLPAQICQILHQKEIASLLVEGGAKTLEGFIASGLWDEARIFTGSQPLGGGVPAPRLLGSRFETRTLGTDRLDLWKND
jgi:diaminohydroxyphosphoribosylaminopyrimidine deaminase/5-amino-6-(5-phosphoribosylamino)uracil reductase